MAAKVPQTRLNKRGASLERNSNQFLSHIKLGMLSRRLEAVYAWKAKAPTATVQAQVNYVVTNGTVMITKYIGSGGHVTISDTINGLLVTSIGRRRSMVTTTA